MDFINNISNLISAIEIEKGSIVLLQFWGENKDLNILDKFAVEVGKVGAIPLKCQYSREFFKDFFSEASDSALEFPEKYFEIFKVADTVIDICMYGVPQPHEEFPKDKLDHYRKYLGNLFRVLMEKEKFVQIKVPTFDNAKETLLRSEDYINRLNTAYTVDYVELKEKCKRTIESYKNKSEVTIYTGEDNKLTFSIENREWYSDNGNGDFPSGEVYIAPIENSGNGNILIPLVVCNGKFYMGVNLEFKNGKVCGCSSRELLEFLNTLPEGSRTLCEFGIGLNDKIKDIVGYEALDEKIEGTIHIAIGMNMMFGGANNAQFHKDFVCRPTKIILK